MLRPRAAAHVCSPSVGLLAEDAVRLEGGERQLRRLHLLELGVRHLAVHHLDVGLRDVDEVPLASVVEQRVRLRAGPRQREI